MGAGMKGEPNYFTLVFEGNIRSFKPNPFKTETPFGIPFAAGVGNAFETSDDLLDALKAAHKWLLINDDPRCITDLKKAEAAIAKAEGRAP